MNPFATKGSGQVELSRKVFRYLMDCQGDDKNPVLLQAIDEVVGFDSLIF